MATLPEGTRLRDWLLLLPATAMLLIPVASTGSWIVAGVDCPKFFGDMTDRSIAVDASGCPHMAYGKDHLYYVRHDGERWVYGTVDAVSRVGRFAALSLDGAGHPHISYYDDDHGTVKYASRTGLGWDIQTVDTLTAGGTSIAALGADQVHICYLAHYGNPYRLMHAYWDGVEWHREMVDSGGQNSSLALDASGHPHVSYLGDSPTGLKYACWDGSTWHTQAVDGPGGQAGYASLALDSDGRPHVSYYDGLSRDLIYARREGDEWIAEIADGSSYVGRYNSIALDSADVPHVSYRDDNSHSVVHAHKVPLGWHREIVDVDNGGAFGFPTSLAVDAEGHPHISYRSYGNGAVLKYAVSDGSTWNVTIVDEEGSVGQYNCLALDANGNPNISYHDARNADLKYASWDGAGWDVQRVDSIGKVGQYTSIAIDALGYPHISYSKGEWSSVLKYARWNGTTWDTEQVDYEVQRIIGRHSSLALDGSEHPHVAYEDRDLLTPTSRLKYARWDGAAWQFDVVEEGGAVGGHASLALDQLDRSHVSYYADGVLHYALRDGAAWQIETVDQPDSGAVGVGYYGSLALDSAGNPHISYSERWMDNPPMVEMRVKYAYGDGSTWHIETVDGWDAEAYPTAMAVDGYDRPQIGYYYCSWSTPVVFELRVACRNEAGWSIETVDDVRAPMEGYLSLVVDQADRRHVSYCDVILGDLKYALGPPLQGGMDPGGQLGAFGLRLQAQSPCIGGAPILLHLPRPAHVSLGVYDLLGRRVCLLQDRFLPAGSHRIAWDGLTGGGSRAAVGIYVCSARAGHDRTSTRLVLLR